MAMIVTHQTAAGMIDSCHLCEHRVTAHSGGAYLGVHHGRRWAEEHECLPETDAEVARGVVRRLRTIQGGVAFNLDGEREVRVYHRTGLADWASRLRDGEPVIIHWSVDRDGDNPILRYIEAPEHDGVREAWGTL